MIIFLLIRYFVLCAASRGTNLILRINVNKNRYIVSN